MSTYSEDLDRIRNIVAYTGSERLDYFKALCQMQELAMQLANEKFELSMRVVMMQEPPREFRPSWTARNSEEWQEVEA
jgi:hypothetical protein